MINSLKYKLNRRQRVITIQNTFSLKLDKTGVEIGGTDFYGTCITYESFVDNLLP